MSLPTNAFWREVLDYLPGLVMLFRIDDKEQAHLMFVSEGISDELGFSPESYVLASEEESVVQADLENLVDKIAVLTHPDGETSDYTCNLTNRIGDKKTYKFDFRIFRPKSSKANLIAVMLFPDDGDEELGMVEAKTERQKKPGVKFVANSSVMKTVMGKIEDLSRQDHHVLIRGERSTGKRTIAEILARKTAVVKSNTQVWVLDLEDMQADQGVRIFAGFDESDTKSTIFDDVKVDLQLVIVELSLLKKSDQKDLLRLLELRSAKGFKTRLIVTSTESIEKLQQDGKLESDFLYKTSFISVFVPALRDRSEDMAEIVKHVAEQIGGVLGQSRVIKENELLARFVGKKLDGNFGELQNEIGKALIVSGSGSDLLEVSRVNKKDVAPRGVSHMVGDLLSYDEMARQYLIRVLEHTRGKIYGKGGAADILKMKPTTLQSKLKKLHIR
jgi:DNA-binding NtrC family response regulator